MPYYPHVGTADILSGVAAPDDTLGDEGEFYFQLSDDGTAVVAVWGPKAAGAWPGLGSPIATGTKISDFSAAASLDGTELVPIVQSGDNVRTTAQNVANLGGGGGSGILSAIGPFAFAFDSPGITPINEIQTVHITGSPNGGTFVLTFPNGTDADAIGWNADATAVQSAIDTALGGAGQNATTGTNPNFTVEFINAYVGNEQPLFTLKTNSLTGGTSPSVTIAESQRGGGAFTLCTPGTTEGIEVGDWIYDVLPSVTTAFDGNNVQFHVGAWTDTGDQITDDLFSQGVAFGGATDTGTHLLALVENTAQQFSAHNFVESVPRKIVDTTPISIRIDDGNQGDPGNMQGEGAMIFIVFRLT